MKAGTGLTRRGWRMLVAGVVWCAVAWLIGQRDLWWPGMFLVGLPALSWLILLPGSARLEVVRHVTPERVSVDGDVEVELVVTPRAGALGGVTRVHDRVPPTLGTSAWQPLPAISGRRPQHLRYTLRPQQRGRHRIGPVEQSRDDGLGLARTAQVVELYSELLVTPQVVPLNDVSSAPGLGMATETALRRTLHGSTDDVLIREYLQGDDVRRIHWRSTARAGQLMVRREERARDPIVTIVLDNRSHSYGGHGGSARFEWAVSAVASLAVHLLSAGFEARLAFADGSVLRPPRGVSGPDDIVLEHLAMIDTDPSRHLLDALAASGQGADDHVLIAVLGRVDAEDVAALSDAGRRRSSCWALLVRGTAGDVVGLDGLAAAGWRCEHAAHGVGLADVWQRLSAGAVR